MKSERLIHWRTPLFIYVPLPLILILFSFVDLMSKRVLVLALLFTMFFYVVCFGMLSLIGAMRSFQLGASGRAVQDRFIQIIDRFMHERIIRAYVYVLAIFWVGFIALLLRFRFLLHEGNAITSSILIAVGVWLGVMAVLAMSYIAGAHGLRR